MEDHVVRPIVPPRERRLWKLEREEEGRTIRAKESVRCVGGLYGRFGGCSA